MPFLDKAAVLYSEVTKEAHSILPKLATDSKFNLALIFAEMNKFEESEELFRDAHQEYLEMGDTASVLDTMKQIKRVSRKSN